MARKEEVKKTEAKPQPKAEVVKAQPMGVAKYESLLIESCLDNTSDFDQKDMTVPRVKLLQALSPELVKKDPAYIADARSGDILLADGTLLEGDEGFLFIPCAYKREGLVFQPNQGGFVANLGSSYDAVLASCINGPNGEKMTPEGNELVETATYFGFVIVDGTPQPCVISMNKSQWKSAKKLNTLIQQYREKTGSGNLIAPPIYWRAWQFTTDATSNDKGSWFIWTTKPMGRVLDLENGEKLFESAKAFREEVLSGAKQAKHDDIAE